jgi:hypothetical protein
MPLDIHTENDRLITEIRAHLATQEEAVFVAEMARATEDDAGLNEIGLSFAEFRALMRFEQHGSSCN